VYDPPGLTNRVITSTTHETTASRSLSSYIRTVAMADMNDAERQTLLDRVNRQSATVGATIPETISVHGEEIALREFLVETRKIETLPPETRELVSRARQTLAAERKQRVERLKTDQLSREEAEALADEIIGIDRARNALKTIRHPDFGDQANSASIDDYKRWLSFVDAIQ